MVRTEVATHRSDDSQGRSMNFAVESMHENVLLITDDAFVIPASGSR